MGSFSTFLFPNPSFAEGVGRIVDFGNTLSQYNMSATPEEADFWATYADWCAVGSDLRRATRRYAKAMKQRKAGPRTAGREPAGGQKPQKAE